LLEHFAKGVLDVHKMSAQNQVKRIFEGFEEDVADRGIGTISEVYDGNPPHVARGAISQAIGVAALLRVNEMIEGFK
jgi:glycogen debranching enzyme